MTDKLEFQHLIQAEDKKAPAPSAKAKEVISVESEVARLMTQIAPGERGALERLIAEVAKLTTKARDVK